MPETAISLVTAVQRHLALPGEKITLAEYKKLTAEDRDDLRAGFEAMGVRILAPKTAN